MPIDWTLVANIVIAILIASTIRGAFNRAVAESEKELRLYRQMNKVIGILEPMQKEKT